MDDSPQVGDSARERADPRARRRRRVPPLLLGFELLFPPSDRQQDLRLVRAALEGRREALDRMGQRLACVPALVRAMNERMGRPLREDEHEEVVQDAVTALWRKLAQYDGRGALETWAYGFCALQMLQFLERRRRRKRLTFGLEVEPDLVDESEALGPLEFEWVHAALERLEPPADEVVRLKHFEGLTFDEVGARLALSPNTAKTHYYRAVRRLRADLAPLWGPENRS